MRVNVEMVGMSEAEAEMFGIPQDEREYLDVIIIMSRRNGPAATGTYSVPG